MPKKISLFCAFFLSGCSLLPGMQNIDTSQMPQRTEPTEVAVNPTLIPITPSLLADKKTSTYYYHVAPADVLSISVWQHPEFNIQEPPTGNAATTPGAQGAAGQTGYLVNAGGNIYFPMVGYVNVSDKTIDEIRVEITKRLKQYVKNPQVNVRVADYRGQKVYVLGEVMKPGFLPINDQPLSIADALTLSGSVDPNAADTRHIYVIRGDFIRPRIFWLNANTPDALLLAQHFSLQPYDILYVSAAPATRWNRVISQLLPTIQTVWFTKSITNT